eukprot:2792570-Prymnesium_polylepis.1
MAPAAAANEQATRARVKLQGSSSAAAVARRGASRTTAQSAAPTRGWCAGSGGLGRCGSSWSLRQTSGSR